MYKKFLRTSIFIAILFSGSAHENPCNAMDPQTDDEQARQERVRILQNDKEDLKRELDEMTYRENLFCHYCNYVEKDYDRCPDNVWCTVHYGEARRQFEILKKEREEQEEKLKKVTRKLDKLNWRLIEPKLSWFWKVRNDVVIF